MTEEMIRKTAKEMGLKDLVKFCDTQLIYNVFNEDTNKLRKVTVALSATRSTSSYSDKANTFKSDGYLIKPYTTKTYDKEGKLSYWTFNPNTLRLNTPASRYTYLIKDGDIVGTKDCKKYDKDSKTHMSEVDKSAIKYLKAKKAHEINIEKMLREMCESALFRYQKAVENHENTPNMTLDVLLSNYRGEMGKAC